MQVLIFKYLITNFLSIESSILIIQVIMNNFRNPKLPGVLINKILQNCFKINMRDIMRIATICLETGITLINNISHFEKIMLCIL